MSRFNDAMRASLGPMMSVDGEPFYVDKVEYPAVDIGELQADEKLVPGGKFNAGSLKITVLQSVMAESGLALHKRLVARGVELRVESITDEGDGGPVLVCGPVGVNPKIGGRK
jgi:hypothetical protein